MVDLIKFDPSVFGAATPDSPDLVGVIELIHGELFVNSPVTIDGDAATLVAGVPVSGPGWQGLTIDASDRA